ncbi:MAG TPA: ATP-binding protein, partial [Sphingomonas sp.]
SLCQYIAESAGAVIVCEEAFTTTTLRELVDALGCQPPWSELPLLVLTSGGKTTRGSLHIAEALGPRGNVTLLERPVRILTLLSAVRTALRSRRRQYEVRDLLAREQAARSQAEAASRAKDQFLATLSHELRTPLNPVLMTVSAMLDDPKLSPDVRDDIAMVKRNVELESKLIDDLLDLTRITRGKLELHPEAVDVHALIDNAIKTCCESDLYRKRLHLSTDFRATSPCVWGDSARLSQVFWNLIKNAVKFTPLDGHITVRTTNEPDGSLVASVIDTGIGIAPESIGRIFDAFEQADRSITRQFGGLGLGLAICRAIVSQHGGTLSVRSDGKGRGATFSVRLASVAEPRATANGSDAPKENGEQGLCVLLVEDHDSTARVMARLLRAMDYHVAVANDIATAKRLVDSDRFDVIISDLGLPDGTGLDLIRHVRRTSRVPAIAVSGYGMEDDVRQSRDAGFEMHLTKPIDLSKLQSAIGRVLTRAG